MNVNDSLSVLSGLCGVSGNENTAAITVLDMLREYTDSCKIINSNVIADFGKREKGKPHVLIDAHLDEVGMTVSYIDDDGFIIPSNIGGIDTRILPAQKVMIRGKECSIFGVVSTLPPHLSSGDSALTDINDVRIDTGYTKQELEKIIEPGSMITFTGEYKKLAADRVTSKSIDDRSGAAAIFRMLDILKDAKYSCSFSVMFSSKEETGEQGAKTGCYHINPDIAIAVDVSFALSESDSPQKCGRAGNGPMIGIAPTLSREISDKLIYCAQKNKIDYQLEIMSGLSGTNADQFAVSRDGVKACTCSIPIKYMHTPAEVADLDDIDKTAALLAAFITEV